MDTNPATPAAPGKEVRIALVFYGGGSLAIYENGVAQEMLRLVRSTCGIGQPQSTETVYAKLAADLDAKFIIDVLSGTSAGGINSVFLAKALVTGATLDDLKNLWFEQGDMNVLLNDAQSTKGEELETPHHPASLLNSQRMYAKLLAAMDGMDRQPQPRQPLVSEVDLAVTATDLEGFPTEIQLTDFPVFERRFKNVFQFRYGDGQNDFTQMQNPMLAFAARCTSAYPFAFEPMVLSGIAPFIKAATAYHGQDPDALVASYETFFPDYRNSFGFSTAKYTDRAFADGGYLQNKPFSYAISKLSARQPRGVVERKLFYIEPDPEHAENLAARVPNALENLLEAATLIPRYQTIREDLERVRERNAIIARVNRCVRQIDIDTAGQFGFAEKARGLNLTAGDWQHMGIHEMAAKFGRCYLAYNRLKLSVLTEDLSALVSRYFSISPESSEFRAMTCLIRAWRENTYFLEPEQAPQPPNPDIGGTENQFLLDFDLRYRLRRIRFVQSKIDELLRGGDRAESTIASLRIDPAIAVAEAFRTELGAIKGNLSPISMGLGAWERRIFTDLVERSPLRTDFENLGITTADLRRILEARPGESPSGRITEEQYTAHAHEFLAQNPEKNEQVNRLAVALKHAMRRKFDEAHDVYQRTLTIPAERPVTPQAAAARDTVRHFYDSFEDYDMTVFPFLYGSGIEDLTPVDLHRISPDDAPSLVDPAKERAKPLAQQRPKLFGTRLAAFGAFLELDWRRNDMMWGRLDAAERIINTLRPGTGAIAERRADLLKQVQAIILREELGEANALQALVVAQTGSSHDVNAYIQSILDPVHALELQRQEVNNPADSDLDRRNAQTLRNLARASTITGKILDGIAKDQQAYADPARWLTRFGQLFFSILQVAAPHSIPGLIFRHWLRVLYFFFALMAVFGFLFDGSRVVFRFGIVGLICTLIVNFSVIWIGDLLAGRSRLVRSGASLVTALLVVGLLALVIDGAQHITPDLQWWAHHTLHLP